MKKIYQHLIDFCLAAQLFSASDTLSLSLAWLRNQRPAAASGSAIKLAFGSGRVGVSISADETRLCLTCFPGFRFLARRSTCGVYLLCPGGKIRHHEGMNLKEKGRPTGITATPEG